MRYSLLPIFLTLFVVLPASAQPERQAIRCELLQSYVGGNLDDWPRLIRQMQALSDGDRTWELELLMARYGLIGYYLGTDRHKRAREVLEEAEEHLSHLLATFPDWASLYAVRASLYGYQIALAMYKAPFIGPKHTRALEQAAWLDRADPLLWLEKGNILSHKPEVFGGDKKLAAQCYQKTLDLLRARPDDGCNWWVVLVQVFQAKTFYQTRQYDQYQAARSQLESTYGKMEWVTDFIDADLID